jgi:hypothetical protein
MAASPLVESGMWFECARGKYSASHARNDSGVGSGMRSVAACNATADPIEPNLAGPAQNGPWSRSVIITKQRFGKELTEWPVDLG